MRNGAQVTSYNAAKHAPEEVIEVVDNANKAVVELRAFFQYLDHSCTEKDGLKDQLSQTLTDADRLANNLNEASRQLQLLL